MYVRLNLTVLADYYGPVTDLCDKLGLIYKDCGSIDSLCLQIEFTDMSVLATFTEHLVIIMV